MARVTIVCCLFAVLAFVCWKVQGDDVCREYDLGAFAAMLGKIQMEVSSLREKMEAQRKANEAQRKAMLETNRDVEAQRKVIEAQEKTILEMNSVVESLAKNKYAESVSFLARNPPKSLPNNDIIVFSTTVHNSGSYYDVGTGIFTAPVTGTYLFSTQLCSVNHVNFQLIVNNAVLGVSYHYNPAADGVCSSMVTVGQLTAGQQAWVKGIQSGAKVVPDIEKEYWNMFAGVLIAQTSD